LTLRGFFLPFVIDVHHLKKSFHQHLVLNDVSFSIQKSEIVGIVGRSGAGKSTLFRCLSALETPDSGTITIEGTQLTPRSARQLLQKIGIVFQSFNLLSRRTVLENILLPLEIQGRPQKTANEKARQIASYVGLETKLDSYPSQLSGGQKQRVAIARALIGEGTLLLCDEFTSALDPITTLDILELLKKLNQQLKVTILLVTHDMNVVREICDRVIILDHGKIIETGSLNEIILRPHSTIAKTLLKSLINRELPHHLEKRLHAKPFPGCDVILRLLFSGQAAHKPLVADLNEKFSVSANIIAGNVDHIREHPLGALIIALTHDTKKLKAIKQYLQDNDVTVDELGYGKWT
jgi:D-methionine transport system ATP-binding protein